MDWQALAVRSSWDDVSFDELVFLIPSLAAHPVAARRTIATLLESDIAAAGAESLDHNQSGIGPPAGGPSELSGDARLALLKTMRAACLTGSSETPGLEQGLLTSAASRINAAYVWQSLCYAAEACTMAAWLGHLLVGRSAYLGPAMGTRLRHDLLPCGDDRSEPLLRGVADLCIGADHLATIADRVCRTGRPEIVAPRSPRARPAGPGGEIASWKAARVSQFSSGPQSRARDCSGHGYLR